VIEKVSARSTRSELLEQVSGLEASLALVEQVLAAERQARAAEKEAAQRVAAERDRLRDAYQALQVELELLRRRMFVAKAERVDTTQLELEFADKLAELDEMGNKLAAEDEALAGEPPPIGDAATGRGPRKARPTGRRDFSDLDVPVERIELPDPALEGQVERIGFEESSRLRWRRGGWVRVVLARIKYREEQTTAGNGTTEDIGIGTTGPADTLPAMIYTTPMPPEILPRGIGTPSLYAHIASDKLCDGLPLYRQEDRFARLGCRIDRGTMSRWLEDLGMIVGTTVVAAARDEAMRTAFCLATDATGVLVQPIRDGTKRRQPCRRGHYFVQIADRDHVFFEYVPRETSAVVGELFRGFGGYVQADAKSVYDILFRPPEERPPPEDSSTEPDLAIRHEVGCWSHCRRKFWEATIAKDLVAREGLARVGHMFALERTWRGRPAAQIKRLRNAHLRPHLDAFFAWAELEYEKVKGQRGLLRSALGYACRQKPALMRFLDDGRLRMDNNESERELRRIATGRKAWLFVGSDDHAQAAGNLLSLIASARLHGLDPEAYLRDLFRVLPHWPRGRFLELAPRYWLATRARLDPAQLEMELGPLTIPPPSPPQ
jgi:hypothetical protein